MRIRPNRRVHITVLAGSGLAALGLIAPAVVSATPAAPAPTVASVTAKLTAIARQSEFVGQQLNVVVVQIASDQRAAKQDQAAAAAATARYQIVRQQLAQTVVAQYEGSAFSATGALLDSSSGQNYMQQLGALNMLSVHRSDIVNQVNTTRQDALAAEADAKSLLAAAQQQARKLQQEQALLTANGIKYRALLATLTAPQIQAYNSYGQASPTAVEQAINNIPVHAGSKAAIVAVDFALRQVGKPYVYDASGPGSYDCSGLTMASWAAAGVALPHNAEAQSHYGTPVNENALQPGDLVFFYNPIGHVTIYIGDGLMVSAPEPGQNVMIVTLSSFQSDYAGATRLT